MLTGILKICYCCGRGVWSFRGVWLAVMAMAAHQRACCGESDLARLGSSGGDGPGVDISNRSGRSQLPINASSVRRVFPARVVITERIFVQSQQLSNSSQLLSSNSLCV